MNNKQNMLEESSWEQFENRIKDGLFYFMNKIQQNQTVSSFFYKLLVLIEAVQFVSHPYPYPISCSTPSTPRWTTSSRTTSSSTSSSSSSTSSSKPSWKTATSHSSTHSSTS